MSFQSQQLTIENSYIPEKELGRMTRNTQFQTTQFQTHVQIQPLVIDIDQHVVETRETRETRHHIEPHIHHTHENDEKCGCCVFVKETKKTCFIWTIFCVCVNPLVLLKCLMVCAALALSIIQVTLATTTKTTTTTTTTTKLIFIDGVLFINLLCVCLFVEYVLYKLTFSEAMLNGNERILWYCELVKKHKHKAYLCVLLLKTILTSVTLSCVVKMTFESYAFITTAISLVLLIQCTAFVGLLCCFKN